ncbi:hypothetical protein BAUCODRAFT_173711 [Baudoinia panamericana UAMH 10762]|uniref:Uncharacterized protein n=1 Tax=Baudoinia panamericana (strain UAMH 10762) TaxID=717646 RepID=M2N8U9_BAUPA|nr:uncharacterized protein BAUCODRAFT_173711 [Baudoinia panamericana UAMH 10762]EMD00569.1 hypothetical protein BAUCODRAFT_173711 [Baudoinia panamericana UAMH 10762]
MRVSDLYYWQNKDPLANAWHPVPGASSVARLDNLALWIKRQDIEAACVDIAPFIVGVGGVAYLRQLNQFGLEARASIFHNAKTLTAMHRTTLLVTPLILACQAAGLEYRRFIPRWAHDRERRRDEEEVRQHVDFGMYAGAACWLVRLYGLRWGKLYWSPIDPILGGALADLAHREYIKAHGF